MELNADDEAVFSIPATRQINSDFRRKSEKEPSTGYDEFKLKMVPFNIILDFSYEQDWQNKYYL